MMPRRVGRADQHAGTRLTAARANCSCGRRRGRRGRRWSGRVSFFAEPALGGQLVPALRVHPGPIRGFPHHFVRRSVSHVVTPVVVRLRFSATLDCQHVRGTIRPHGFDSPGPVHGGGSRVLAQMRSFIVCTPLPRFSPIGLTPAGGADEGPVNTVEDRPPPTRRETPGRDCDPRHHSPLHISRRPILDGRLGVSRFNA